jgi:hypothetical protein
MIYELEIWKKAVVALSRYYPGICLERLKTTKRNFRKDRQCPFRLDPTICPIRVESVTDSSVPSLSRAQSSVLVIAKSLLGFIIGFVFLRLEVAAGSSLTRELEYQVSNVMVSCQVSYITN